MGTTNYGNQILTFDYAAPATSEGFNRLNYKLHPTGIYSGGLLTKISATSVSLSNLSCFISDDADNVGLRIETTDTITINNTVSTLPYIVLRLTWKNISNNYMDVLTVAYEDIQDNDLIVGRCIYLGGELQTSFDYSRRTKPIVNELKSDEEKLKVLPTEPYSNQVLVQEGNIITTSGYVTVSEQTSVIVSDTVNGRIDLITLDQNGLIGISEGTDSVSPEAPSYAGKTVIGEIRRGAGRSNITGHDIINVKSDLGGSGGSGTTISVLTAYENISKDQIVSFDSNGAIVASKDDSTKINVVGISLTDALAGNDVLVHKVGLVEEMDTTDLVKGEPCFLSNNGGITQDPTSDIGLDEYRVFIGYAIGESSIDVNIGEPVLISPDNQYWDSVPLGTILIGSSSFLREGYLRPNGQAISRTNYSELNSLYSDDSYPYGNGDGSTTFNLPNYGDPASMIKVRHVEARSLVEQVAVDTRLITIENNYKSIKEITTTPYSVLSTDVYLNINLASGTINLPVATGSGKRIKLSKIHSTVNTITISPNGTDTITLAGELSSITLRTQGNFWELLDIKAGVWEIVAGFESIISTSTQEYRYADGRQEIRRNPTISDPSSSGNVNVSWTLPFVDLNFFASGLNGLQSITDAGDFAHMYIIDSGPTGRTTTSVTLYYELSSAFTYDFRPYILIHHRWY